MENFDPTAFSASPGVDNSGPPQLPQAVFPPRRRPLGPFGDPSQANGLPGDPQIPPPDQLTAPSPPPAQPYADPASASIGPAITMGNQRDDGPPSPGFKAPGYAPVEPSHNPTGVTGVEMPKLNPVRRDPLSAIGRALMTSPHALGRFAGALMASGSLNDQQENEQKMLAYKTQMAEEEEKAKIGLEQAQGQAYSHWNRTPPGTQLEQDYMDAYKMPPGPEQDAKIAQLDRISGKLHPTKPLGSGDPQYDYFKQQTQPLPGESPQDTENRARQLYIDYQGKLAAAQHPERLEKPMNPNPPAEPSFEKQEYQEWAADKRKKGLPADRMTFEREKAQTGAGAQRVNAGIADKVSEIDTNIDMVQGLRDAATALQQKYPSEMGAKAAALYNIGKYKLGVSPDDEYKTIIPNAAALKAYATGPLLHGIRNQKVIQQIWQHIPDATDSPKLFIEKLDVMDKIMRQLRSEKASAAHIEPRDDEPGGGAPVPGLPVPPQGGKPPVAPGQGHPAAQAAPGAPAPYASPNDVKAAMQAGKISPEQAHSVLVHQFGFTD